MKSVDLLSNDKHITKLSFAVLPLDILNFNILTNKINVIFNGVKRGKKNKSSYHLFLDLNFDELVEQNYPLETISDSNIYFQFKNTVNPKKLFTDFPSNPLILLFLVPSFFITKKYLHDYRSSAEQDNTSDMFSGTYTNFLFLGGIMSFPSVLTQIIVRVQECKINKLLNIYERKPLAGLPVSIIDKENNNTISDTMDTDTNGMVTFSFDNITADQEEEIQVPGVLGMKKFIKMEGKSMFNLSVDNKTVGNDELLQHFKAEIGKITVIDIFKGGVE